MKHVLAPTLVMLLLAGCATAPEVASVPARAGLTPRDIAPDSCALYVWTAGPERTFTYFASRDEAALWEGVELTLGTPDTPLAPDQTLEVDYGGETYTWELGLRDPESFAGGVRYASGLIRSANQGFERVLPVVGLATCAPDAV